MKTLLVALGALSLIGCSSLKPVGPLAKQAPITQQGQPLPGAPAEPVARAPAVRPAPPTLLVTPGDVNPDNPRDAANKLAAEVTADTRATASAPVTVDVSRVPRNGGR